MAKSKKHNSQAYRDRMLAVGIKNRCIPMSANEYQTVNGFLKERRGIDKFEAYLEHLEQNNKVAE